ncbi:MAG: hypothetical protein JWO67_527 [Streptosporangiaceae bacterium]|jgi:hypothetical protein|nr:hypothetical protein [Streptosporangiaceae bacterium]
MARAGFAVSGVLHLLIGLIAIQVAAGVGQNEADQSGALAQLASLPGGALLLWATVVGLTALGLWLIVSSFLSLRRGVRKRFSGFVQNFAKGLVYLVLAFTALTFARGGSTSAASTTSGSDAGLLASPGGVVLAAAIGVAIFGVGVYLLVKGLSRRFRRDLSLPHGGAGRATVALGVFGYVAKGVALAVVGGLFVVAALTVDPAKATGLDGALKTLLQLPFGAVILTVVGAGLIAYGLYSFVRARYARL